MERGGVEMKESSKYSGGWRVELMLRRRIWPEGERKGNFELRRAEEMEGQGEDKSPQLEV